MNIVDTFKTLSPPTSCTVFNAITLFDFPFAKIAINSEEQPAILISSKQDNTFMSQKNVRLKYLELTHSVECKVSEADKIQFENFTLIVFRSNQEYLQNYFLGIAEILIKSLSEKPTQQRILQTFRNFVEIFRALSDSPTKTIQGLWSELFLIDNSKTPKILLNYWHCLPEEKFDFNAGFEKIEVKSNANFERIHIFSAEQLNPPEGTKVLIASLFVRQSNTGKSIQDLINSITVKVNLEFDLVGKLNILVCKTLGNTLEQSIKIKFDYRIAEDSLRFYQYQDIKRVEKINIPKEVSEVRFKSDLSTCRNVVVSTLGSNNELFSSVN